MCLGRFTAALLFGALAWGCSASHVVVTVVDPQEIASAADTLAIGFQRNIFDDERAIGERGFPLTFALEYHRVVPLEVWVEARDVRTPVARGSVSSALNQGDGVTITLGRTCNSTADCTDGIFCNGEESCLENICRVGPEPCPDLGSRCSVHRCDEGRRYCEIVNAPGFDDFSPCTKDVCGADGEPIHLPVDDGAMCIGQLGNCVGGTCGLECGDGFLDPRVEECDSGMMNDPNCMNCRIGMRKLSREHGGPAVISDDGAIVLLRDGERLVKLKWRTNETEDVAVSGLGSGIGASRISMSRDGRKIAAHDGVSFKIWRDGVPVPIPESITSYAQLVVSGDSSHYLVVSTGSAMALIPFAGDDIDAWAAVVSEVDTRAEIDGGAVLYQSRVCRPCLRRSDLEEGDERTIARDAGGWALSNEGLRLFVARDGHVFRYDAPYVLGVRISGTDGATEVSASRDGLRLVFTTAVGISPDDLNQRSDIYALDLSQPEKPARRVGAPRGIDPDENSSDPKISGDGEWVVFNSLSSNFRLGDTGGMPQVYLTRFDADF